MAREDQYIHTAAGTDIAQAKAAQLLAAWRKSSGDCTKQQPAPSQLPCPPATAAACALNSRAIRRTGWVLSAMGLPRLRHPPQTASGADDMVQAGRRCCCGRCATCPVGVGLAHQLPLSRHTREVSRPNTLVRAQSLATRICE